MTRQLRTGIALLLFCVAPLLFAPRAVAHKASTSYLHLRAAGEQLTGRMDLAVRDLDFALQVDADGNGAITWGELKAARPSIADYIARRLTVSSAGNRCRLTVDDLRVVAHSDGNYAVLTLAGACPSRIVSLDIDYELLFDVDALHRGLADIEFASPRSVESQSALFAPDAHVLHFAPAASTLTRVFGQYFKAGLIHVWSGLDHLLFLAGLFLPAVQRRIHGRWTPVSNLRTALRDTALIVTAFTIAHACTLSLAALGTFTVPSRVVESAVALTVLFAGLNNLVPMVYRNLFWLSGVFGLIHGAAVASALIDLGLPATGRVWALLAFNVGVEAAQLSLLALVIFPAYTLRNTRFYRFGLLSPGSAVVATVGLCWFVERAFGVYFGMPLP